MADRDDALARLERELRSPAPAGVRAVRAGDLEHLAAAIAEARHRQAAAIGAAAERGLRFVPRLLRGPVRKMVGG
ncbi:MAG TPA: hypothetical protein VKT31_10850 [Solirubrobacteraceae bacterium]|nr:hypothetical protein [Solirubrobacteraceae bacterium]